MARIKGKHPQAINKQAKLLWNSYKSWGRLLDKLHKEYMFITTVFCSTCFVSHGSPQIPHFPPFVLHCLE
jgi:hypothetical protein